MSTCQWAYAPCKVEATETQKVKVGEFVFAAELCTYHLDAIQGVVMDCGFEIQPARARNGTKRIAYVAQSGTAFTTRDVRQWGLQTGKITDDKGRGRVGERLIDEYASAH